jgi:predicted  nucleic acid-binding Zn-ribbon protein
MNTTDQCEKCGRYLYTKKEAAMQAEIERLKGRLETAEMDRFEQGREIERLRSALEALRHEHPIGLSGKAFDIVEDALK